MTSDDPLTLQAQTCNVLGMETPTEAAEPTPAVARIALGPSNGRVSVSSNGVVLGTVKNGGEIVKNAEKILRAHRILRATGYSLQEGMLVALGVQA